MSIRRGTGVSGMSEVTAKTEKVYKDSEEIDAELAYVD